jgi:protein SDA1
LFRVLPLFFKLLRCQDKILRRKLHDSIISDLTKINLAHKNNSVNKTLQNFCIENMLNDPNKKAARKTLNIMIILYKKKIWNDSKTINAIAQTCTSNDPKIAYASCQFFLSEYEEAEQDSSDEEELDELKSRYKLLGKANNKKTKTRKNKIKNLMKAIERREKRRSNISVSKDFMPIDLLNDPTNFAEKIYSKLKNLKENFKLKLAFMRLIGRVIGRHKLYISNFYSYMLSHLSSNQTELSVIFAALIEACHDLVPPGDLDPIIYKLYDNFISETLPAPLITIGLNTLREIIERSPYVLKKEYITEVELLKEFKNKSVANAARSLINCIKEINSNVLNIYDSTKEKEIIYGQSKVSDSIEGIDLLKKHENLPEDYKMEYDVLLDDMQLKKLRVLRMKYSAEKVQNRKLNLSKGEINQMAGEKKNKEKKTKSKDEKKFQEDDMEEGEFEENENEEFDDEDEISDEEGEYEEGEFEEGEEIEDENDEHNFDPELSLNESENEEEIEDEEELEVDEEGSISESESDSGKISIHSDELKSNSSDEEEENVHGFVDPDALQTYRKKFNEKKEMLKNQEKEQYVHNRKQKSGGLTNKEKEKNKPMMMVIPKKRKQVQAKLISMNKKIKNIKQQLGRFKRGNMVLKKKGGLTKKK